MAYIDQVTVSGTTYDIHDARITGGVLNFAGVVDNTSGIVDGGTPAAGYKEGDVVINVVSGKEFVVVNTGTTASPVLKWAEFGDASDMGGTALDYVTATGSYDKPYQVSSTSTTVTTTGNYTPAGTNTITQPADGTAVTFSASYTPAGSNTISQPATGGTTVTFAGSYDKATGFSGTAATLSVKGSYIKPSGSGTFEGTSATISVSGSMTASGSINVVNPTASINKVTAVSTASKNVVSSVATGAAATVSGTTLVIGTVVTGVTTAAQTMVTGVTTASQTVVTGQPTTKTFTGSAVTVTSTGDYTPEGGITVATSSVTLTSTGSYTPAGSVSTTATDINTTGTLKATFGGTAATISATGKLASAFTGTAGTVTTTGAYDKATGITTTAATVTVTSSKRFAAENE